MAYCIQTDLLNRISEDALIQLTDDTGTATEPVADIISQAIADADSEIDTYLASRYSVPINPIPSIVQKLSVDISIYNLFGRRDLNIPDTRRVAYENAVGLLRAISNGIAALGVDDPAPTNTSGPVSSKTVDDRIMTMDSMALY